MVGLRTAQKLFLDKAEESRKKGYEKGLLVFPTGLGKSIASFSDMNKFNGKFLVLAHNKDLLIQLAEDFKKVNKTKKIGFMYKIKKDFNAQAIFANVRTMGNYLSKFHKEEFDYIIVDESHHVTTKTYKKILDYFKPKFLLGMTATPNRTDKKSILPTYDNNVIIEIDEKEAMKKKWLRPYKIVCLWDKWCNYGLIANYRSDEGLFRYNIREVGKKYIVPERIKGIINILKEGIKEKGISFKGIGNRKGVYFCVRRIVAKKYCEEFNKAGIKSAYLEGNMKDKKRVEILEDFKKGKYQLIFNVDLIGEGFHIPKVDLVILDRPTDSFIKHKQQKGRQIFNIEGEEYDREGLLIDLVGNSKNHYRQYTYNISEKKKYKNEEIKELIENSIGVPCEFQSEVLKDFCEKISYDYSWDIVNNLPKNKILDLYNKGIPTDDIAKKFNCSTTSILRALRKYGIKTDTKATKEELIKEFLRVKNLLGRKPQMRETGKYGQYSYQQYVTRFGSWNDFLKEIGEPVRYYRSKEVTKEDLINNYYFIKRKLSLYSYQIPRIKDINNRNLSKYGCSLYQSHFGSWNDFLIYLKEKGIKYNSIGKEKLIKSFLKIKKQYPNCNMHELKKYGGHSISTYRRQWGNVNNFLREVGFPLVQYKPKKEEMIEDYLNVKNKLGKIPIYEDMKKYGKFHPSVMQKKWGSWSNFIKEMEGYIPKKMKIKNPITKEDIKEKFLEYILSNNKKICESSKGSNGINIKEFSKWSGIPKHIIDSRGFRLREFLNNRNNIKITSTYKPKTIIIPIKKNRKGLKKSYEGLHKEEFKSKVDKIDIRKRIISKIQDGDNVLLLESPDLSALKEIEKQNKKPNKIIIPNNKEFKKLVNAIQNYKTDLNIEIVNTSILQYLVDSEEKFDFLWLDYCGAFSYYMKDLDILFSKKFNNIKLVLTYNLFDPAKEDENYYFTRVIDYVLSKNEANKIRLMNDVSYRYKKNMYNIGFNIQKVN